MMLKLRVGHLRHRGGEYEGIAGYVRFAEQGLILMEVVHGGFISDWSSSLKVIHGSLSISGDCSSGWFAFIPFATTNRSGITNFRDG